jgi:hypothetical protein
MRFLRQTDYSKQIREKNLLDIISNEEFNRIESENLAIREMQNYLSCKYDVEKIFAPLFTFDIAQSYTEGQRINYTEEDYDNLVSYVVGDRVSYQDKIYNCIADSTGNLPTDTNFWEYITADNSIYVAAQDTAGNYPEDATYWTFGDDRDPLILTYCIDITLYHVHSRINPRNIPQLRIDRYDMAMMWLKGIKTGESPVYNLPELDLEDNEGRFIRIGSNNPRPQYY